MKVRFINIFRDSESPPQLLFSGLIYPEVLEGFDYFIFAVLPYEGKPNGIPFPTELKRVHEEEERLCKALEKERAVSIGHIIGNFQCKSVFISQNPAPAFADIKLGLLKKKSIALESRYDPNWLWYEEHLKPTRLEEAVAMNHQLLQKFSELGDVNTAVRTVDFLAFFFEESQRTLFRERIVTLGFSIPSEVPCAEDSEDSFRCEFTKETSVEELTMAELRVLLEDTCVEFGGYLDGWAAHAVIPK